MDAVADVVVDDDGPAEGLEFGGHFAAELVPEGIGGDAAGVWEPAVAAGG